MKNRFMIAFELPKQEKVWQWIETVLAGERKRVRREIERVITDLKIEHLEKSMSGEIFDSIADYEKGVDDVRKALLENVGGKI